LSWATSPVIGGVPLSSRFTDETAAGRGAAKDGQWQRHGYGPWAVLVEGEFAGWGGFRREEYGVDYALVLAGAVGA
jgi:[ribosomal protein S5]-alanine N-acetyltransferase